MTDITATCPSCQQPVEPGAAYCANCGFKLTQTTKTGDETAVPSPTPSTAPATPTDAATAAMTLPGTANHSSKAIIGLVLSILSLVSWLLPIAGIVVGVLAIVFASQAVHSRHRKLAIASLLLAGIGLILSLGSWVHNVQTLQGKIGSSSPTVQSVNKAATQTVTSPCYNTRIPTGFTLTQIAGNCTFSAINNDSGEEYDVKVISAPNVSEANLPTAAQKDAQQTVNTIAGGSISQESSGEFAGHSAYLVDVTATDGGSGRIAYVYGPTAQGNITIVIHVQSKPGTDTSLSTIENSWNWL